MKNIIPRVWTVDRSPTDTRYTRSGNVERSIQIGVDVIPTFTTPKIVPLAVSFIGVTAFRTFLARIPRVYTHNLFTKRFGFIPDKLLKLVERPVVELPVKLSPASAVLDSNAGEVFKRKYIEGHIHDLFRDTVVNILNKPFFFSADLLKKTFSRLSAFALEFSPKMLVFASNILNLFAIKESIVRAHSDVHDASIDSENLITRWFGRVRSHGNMQIERIRSLVIPKRGASDFPMKILIVVFWKIERCLNPTTDRCNANQMVKEINPDYPFIVPNSGKWRAFRDCFEFNTLKCLTCNVPDTLQERGRDFRMSLSGRVISPVMDFYLAARSILKSKSSDLIKHFVADYDSLAKRLCILIRDFKFEFDRSIHIHILAMIPYKSIGGEAQFKSLHFRPSSSVLV